MSIRFELYAQPKGVDSSVSEEVGSLSEKEEVRFLNFAQAMRKVCVKANLAKHISFIRLSPAHEAGGSGIQRDSQGDIGVCVVMGIRFGHGKQRQAKEFAFEYWGNLMSERIIMVPLGGTRLNVEAERAVRKIVTKALEYHRETSEPVIELGRVLSSLDAQG